MKIKFFQALDANVTGLVHSFNLKATVLPGCFDNNNLHYESCLIEEDYVIREM